MGRYACGSAAWCRHFTISCAWRKAHASLCSCCVQVPKLVSGKDVAVTLKDHRYLEIQARIGIQDVRRVEGLLRRPVKDIGNGSTWELTSEDCCKVHTLPQLWVSKAWHAHINNRSRMLLKRDATSVILYEERMLVAQPTSCCMSQIRHHIVMYESNVVMQNNRI